jgi:hypothetical protein
MGGNVACIEEMKNACKILVRKPGIESNFGGMCKSGRIILKWILCMNIWTGFS